MRPFIEYGDWVEIDGDSGITYVPGDIFMSDFLETVRQSEEVTDDILEEVRDYYESSTIHSVTITTGFGARMSAPGYMDCTEWSVFGTEAEAEEYLEEYYGDEEDDSLEQEIG
jgi:hypothetical protein